MVRRQVTPPCLYLAKGLERRSLSWLRADGLDRRYPTLVLEMGHAEVAQFDRSASLVRKRPWV